MLLIGGEKIAYYGHLIWLSSSALSVLGVAHNLDDDVRFSQSVHERPALNKRAVEEYERTALSA
jgi:hypothetical protein